MQDYIILPVRSYCMKFFGVLSDLDMPEFDVEAAMSVVFNCLKEEELVEKKLIDICIDMAQRDGLFENEEFDDGQQQQIYNAVERLGKDLFNYYQRNGMYINGLAPYDYEGTFDGCALLISEPYKGFPSLHDCTRYVGGP